MTRARLALLLALLPGLLLSSGASVRVCLHALVGARADCATCCDERPACCGGERRPAGPAVSNADDCASCCVDLQAAAQQLGASERLAELTSLPPAAPVGSVLFEPCELAPRHAPPGARATPRATPAGRGILPLRI